MSEATLERQADVATADPASQRSGGVDMQFDPCWLVYVSGDLDAATAPTLLAELEPLIERNGDIHVDVAGVEFIGAAGINVFAAAARALGERGRVVLRDPAPSMRRIIGITQLDQLLDVVTTGAGKPTATRDCSTASAATSRDPRTARHL